MECYRTQCIELGEKEPKDIAEAKAVLKTKLWVNVIDFINFCRIDKRFEIWGNFKEFKKYIYTSGKRFHLRDAGQNDFLSLLLVDFIKNPNVNRPHDHRKRTRLFQSNSRV